MRNKNFKMEKITKGEKIEIFTPKGRMFARSIILKSIQKSLGIIADNIPENLIRAYIYEPDLLLFFKKMAKSLAECRLLPERMKPIIQMISTVREEHNLVLMIENSHIPSLMKEALQDIFFYITEIAPNAMLVAMDSGIWEHQDHYGIAETEDVEQDKSL